MPVVKALHTYVRQEGSSLQMYKGTVWCQHKHLLKSINRMPMLNYWTSVIKKNVLIAASMSTKVYDVSLSTWQASAEFKRLKACKPLNRPGGSSKSIKVHYDASMNAFVSAESQ